MYLGVKCYYYQILVMTTVLKWGGEEEALGDMKDVDWPEFQTHKTIDAPLDHLYQLLCICMQGHFSVELYRVWIARLVVAMANS